MLEKELELFLIKLAEEERREKTIRQYKRFIKEFFTLTGATTKEDITKPLLIEYKDKLKEIHQDKYNSINIKIIVINKFIAFLRYDSSYKLHQEKEQKKTSLENVLNYKEYLRLLEWSKKLNKEQMYYLMETLAETGIRISELKFVTLEAVKSGKLVIINKGKKRIIGLEKQLIKDLKHYCNEKGITAGEIFISKQGNSLDNAYIWRQLQDIARKS